MGVSVRQKKPGGPYWIFVNHHGKRKSKQIGSQTAAEKIADIIRGKLAENDLGFFEEKKDKQPPLFKEVAVDWLELDIKQRCRKTTYDRYKSILKMYVNPVLGKLRVSEITRPIVKDLLRSMVNKQLSRSTVETAKNCISGTCEYAIDEGILPVDANPARGALKNTGVAKKSDRKPVEVLTADEIELILATTKKYRPDYYHLFLTACRSGLRLGEILALKWSNIDFLKGQIVVEYSWRNSVLTGTKTGKVRYVDMTDQLQKELTELLHQRKIEAVKKGKSEPIDVIFHDKGGNYRSQNSTRNIWARMLQKVGLPHKKFHITRHTFASILMAANVPISYVSKTMGHSSIQMTVDIYGHLMPDRDKSAINVLDQFRTLSAPIKKETPVTNGYYEGFSNLVAMQGLEPRTLRI